MADIPGIKSLRLIAGSAIVALPDGAFHTPSGKLYSLELGFDDGSVVSVKITEQNYKDIRERMAKQTGVALEERMAARGDPAAVGRNEPVPEVVLPLDAKGPEITTAISAVLRQVVEAPGTSGSPHIIKKE